MRLICSTLFCLFALVSAKNFSVIYNTVDPSVFGTQGGAHLNATGDGFVDALTLCIRFQVWYLRFKLIVQHDTFFSSLQVWLGTTAYRSRGASSSTLARDGATCSSTTSAPTSGNTHILHPQWMGMGVRLHEFADKDEGVKTIQGDPSGR